MVVTAPASWRFVLGWWGTGETLLEIDSPASGTTWSDSLSGQNFTLRLDPSDRMHRIYRKALATDQTRCLTLLDEHPHPQPPVGASGMPVIASGPVISHHADPDSWEWSIGSPYSYLSRRALVLEGDPNLGTRQPVYVFSGTWRQVVQQALDLIAKPAGGWAIPPHRVTLPLTAGPGGTIEVEAVDFETVTSLLDGINSRADGVEVRLRPRWYGAHYPDGYAGVEVAVGATSTHRVPIDLTADTGPVEVLEYHEDGAGRATDVWVTGGRGSDEVLVSGVQDWPALAAGVPPLDLVDTSRTNESAQAVLAARASALLVDVGAPVVTAKIRALVGASPDPLAMPPGTWVDMTMDGDGHPVLPEGRHQMRVVGRSWSIDSPDWVDLDLVGVRPADRWT